MKKLLTSLAISSFLFSLSAQQTQEKNELFLQKEKSFHLAPGKKNDLSINNNTKSLNSRNIGYNIEYYESSTSTWVEDDSIAMTYSGIRGGVYQTDNYQPDQENIYNWSGSSWNYPSKNIHTYNSENQITTSISMNWSFGSWENNEKQSYTYTPTQKISSYTFQDWIVGDWFNSLRETYAYDANDNQTIYFRENWVSGAWEPDYKTISTYDVSNNLTTEIIFVDGGNGFMENNKTDFTYNANNLLISETFHSWTAGSWEQTKRNTYTLDINNNVSSIYTEMFNTGTWEPSRLTTNTYNSENLITESVEQASVLGVMENNTRFSFQYDANNNNTIYQQDYWIAGTWQAFERYTYEFVANNMTMSTLENWDGSIWQLSTRFIYSYNSFDQLLTRIYQISNMNDPFENVSREFYYYETYQDGMGIGESSIKANAAYPNPFIKNTLIDFSSKGDGELTFSVADMNGQIIFTEKNYYPTGSNSILFDGSNLKSGIYFYTLSGAAGITTGKLIKQ